MYFRSIIENERREGERSRSRGISNEREGTREKRKSSEVLVKKRKKDKQTIYRQYKVDKEKESERSRVRKICVNSCVHDHVVDKRLSMRALAAAMYNYASYVYV